MLTMDADDKPAVVTITTEDVKRLRKSLKKGAKDRPTPTAEDVKAEIDEMYRQEDAKAKGDVIKPAATNKQLLAFVERVETVELELAERSEDRKQIYAEARSCGFDVPTLKKIVALRKMDDDDRIAAEALLATYMHAVGMAVQTEMGF
jgi:uncharacterized protein (UPF0335 family)